MFGLLKKKKVFVPLTGVVALALAAAAVAYFTSTGSGTGSATVGSATNWSVTFPNAASGTMYPGAGSTTIPYTVTNPSSGHQYLTGTTATVASSGGNITQNGVAVSGCLASWFTPANTSPARERRMRLVRALAMLWVMP